jgi:NAD(P)-dependent dehydrogenase (short-subunit alcohol dehydrogenase family)
LVIGAGDGLGMAVARAFSAEGMAVALTRRARNLAQLEASAQAIRDAGAKAYAFGMDARVEGEIADLFARVEREIGPIAVCVFNVGANVRFGIADTTAQVYSKVWEMAAFAGFLSGREAARVMTPRGRGTIIFTGATASLRGRDGFAAFAGAKHALRALAQSMARELGPKGIHVAHTVIDGPIDGAFIRSVLPDWEARLAEGRLLIPDEIAKGYVWLHRQHRSAWTHELDFRPWAESW